MSTQITRHPFGTFSTRSFAELWQTRQDAERYVRVEMDLQALPDPVRLVSHDDAVHIFTTDIADLEAWLIALGGTVRVSPAHGGVCLWTLHTATTAEGRIPSVPVRVSVPVQADELVMHNVRAAVAA